MDYQLTNNLVTYHANEQKLVKKVLSLQQTLSLKRPTDVIRYFWEVFGENNEAMVIPLTVNDVEEFKQNKRQAIRAGRLQDAYRFQLMLGSGHPTEEEGDRFPWFSSFYNYLWESDCERCGRPLLEDRGMSRSCQHQLCTACTCLVTAEAGANLRCEACNCFTRYLLFNGEQANDERDHKDIVVFY